MNLRKNWKRFWTLSKAREGFTLVELIVVIAILAILAGVAVPAYSGYIAKANKAGDLQLLSAVNTAFAAAALENGDDVTKPASAPAMPLTGDAGAKSIDFDNIAPVEYQDAFKRYFAGNTGTFKVIEELKFENGVFIDANDAATQAITIGGKTYYVSQSAIDNFKAAEVFSQNVGQMQGQVDKLTSAYGSIVGLLEEEQWTEAFGPDYAAFLNDIKGDKDKLTDEELGNATVLYVAEKSANMTAESAKNTLAGAATYLTSLQPGESADLMTMLKGQDGKGDALANAAMMYGAITAYANSSNGDKALKDQAAEVKDAGSLMALYAKAAETEGFLEYCGLFDNAGNVNSTLDPNSQFATDMNGYLGALEAMGAVSEEIKNDPNKNLGSSDVWSENTAINEMLSQILGNSSN